MSLHRREMVALEVCNLLAISEPSMRRSAVSCKISSSSSRASAFRSPTCWAAIRKKSLFGSSWLAEVVSICLVPS